MPTPDKPAVDKADTLSADNDRRDTPVTLITGASSGIGRALALSLADKGRAVALVARRQEVLDEAVAQIVSDGGRAMAVAADVTDRDALATAVARVESEFGPVACLIANAGGGHSMSVGEFDAGAFADIVELNLLGTANALEAVLPAMRRRGDGHLVAVGSLAGRLGLPRGAAYSAAKAGVARMMIGLRADLADDGIAVTLIEPGFVDTRGKGSSGSRRKPFRLALDDAVARMVRAIEARTPTSAFPWPLVALIAFMRIMPAPVYNRLINQMARR